MWVNVGERFQNFLKFRSQLKPFAAAVNLMEDKILGFIDNTLFQLLPLISALMNITVNDIDLTLNSSNHNNIPEVDLWVSAVVSESINRGKEM